jgi:hypothetical protein
VEKTHQLIIHKVMVEQIQVAQEETQINQDQLHLKQEVLVVEPVVTGLVQICK